MISFPSLKEDGTGLRVDFEWQEDRFQHTVFAVEGDSRFSVWESSADSSPVFQELHEQEDDSGRPMVLLVGASDRIYWSMSVQVPVAGSICFDVAARSSQTVLEEMKAPIYPSLYSRSSSAVDFPSYEIVVVPDSEETRVLQDHVRTSIWNEVPSNEVGKKFTMRRKYLMVLEKNEE